MEKKYSGTNAGEELVQGRTARAFQAFQRAIEEGETDDFLALITGEFSFRVPLPFEEWKEEQHGGERFKDLVRFEREVLEVRLAPLFEIEDGKRGMVAFRAEGTLNESPYRNELAIVFEFEGHRISAFREYVGMPLKRYE
ncbi:nuclear transport factor 2 family protein [Paenibacillus chibensis]|uniref:Nuclear transport factor 2 family protein n=1 Tax=Paenibacillus chibensis TaxID=59846 RepID=A0ABU6PLW2_9BACL|nr:nuclear transport factor 2 family protein [Paenibacillus chibensis]